MISYLPVDSYKEIGTGKQIESENLVEFRLLYSGKLYSTGNKSRPEEVHAIRRKFHPQLRKLWETNHDLKLLARIHPLKLWISKNHGKLESDLDTPERIKAGIEEISYNWERAGFNFVPLITEELCLKCRIEILFLRPDEKRYLMESGDLDGRIKTIFDALRIPKGKSETGGMGPQDDETPFFCLLADDSLITEISVAADRLLLLPEEREIDSKDAFLVINVQFNHRSLLLDNSLE